MELDRVRSDREGTMTEEWKVSDQMADYLDGVGGSLEDCRALYWSLIRAQAVEAKNAAGILHDDTAHWQLSRIKDQFVWRIAVKKGSTKCTS